MARVRLLIAAILLLFLVTQVSSWGLVRRMFNNVKAGTEKLIEDGKDGIETGVNAVKKGTEKLIEDGKEGIKTGVNAVKKGVQAVITELTFCSYKCKPRSVARINPVFWFYSHKNPEKLVKIINYAEAHNPNILNTMKRIGYQSNLRTVIITHGYMSDAGNSEFQWLKKEYMKKVDVNMFIVDWHKGSNDANFMQSVANTRPVGKSIGVMIRALRTQNVHLIGHSLGAHVMGFAGKELKGKIERITGLDAAQPGFENKGPGLRLDPTDARFVDAIHTDAEPTSHFGFGIIRRVGHVDFYANGGEDQPGCPKSTVMKLLEIITTKSWKKKFTSKRLSCSHNRATRLFIASIQQCKFPDKKKLHFMGYDANKNSRGRFDIATGQREPYYCPNGYIPSRSIPAKARAKVMAIAKALPKAMKFRFSRFKVRKVRLTRRKAWKVRFARFKVRKFRFPRFKSRRRSRRRWG